MEKIKQPKEREDNPFENEEVAQQWIRSVEGEQGMTRDREIYPLLQEWSSEIKTGSILEIGSGQGICSQQLSGFEGEYIGVEPSEALSKRAERLYGDDQKLHFVIGNAYELPVATESIDGSFSVNVWFHLADLGTASKELERVLKPGGKFNIITANPESYDVWRTFFEDYTEQGKVISGKVNIPVSPLTRNDFYMHTTEEMTAALETNGLVVSSINPLGTLDDHPGNPLFVSILGQKRSGK